MRNFTFFGVSYIYELGNIALRDVFSNVRLGFADRREIIVASARRSPNSLFGRIFFRNKFPRKQRPSRALRWQKVKKTAVQTETSKKFIIYV
jgi:hypothetical protein